MDEVFGEENFASIITFSEHDQFGHDWPLCRGDYIVWYHKDKSREVSTVDAS
jgi:hypothetical protein